MNPRVLGALAEVKLIDLGGCVEIKIHSFWNRESFAITSSTRHVSAYCDSWSTVFQLIKGSVQEQSHSDDAWLFGGLRDFEVAISRKTFRDGHYKRFYSNKSKCLHLSFALRGWARLEALADFAEKDHRISSQYVDSEE